MFLLVDAADRRGAVILLARAGADKRRSHGHHIAATNDTVALVSGRTARAGEGTLPPREYPPGDLEGRVAFEPRTTCWNTGDLSAGDVRRHVPGLSIRVWWPLDSAGWHPRLQRSGRLPRVSIRKGAENPKNADDIR